MYTWRLTPMPCAPDAARPLLQVATAVGGAAIQDGVAQIEKPDDLEAYMADRMW